MISKWTAPVRRRFFGNQEMAQRLMGVVRKELGTLHNLMSFQNLQTLSRQVQVDEYTHIHLMITRGQAIATIFAMQPEPPVAERPPEFPSPIFKEFVSQTPRERVLLIVSTPSGAEAFAWDFIDNELFLPKDTYANIAAAISGSPSQALPAGQLMSTEFPHYFRVAHGGAFYTATPEAGAESNEQTIHHHNNFYLLLSIKALAFGANGDPEQGEDINHNRYKWEPGDTVVLQSTADSSSVSVVSVNSENGEFDATHVTAYNVTQTWTITLHGDVRRYWVEGDTLGVIEDTQYSGIARSLYPLTPTEIDNPNYRWADRLYNAGFDYQVEQGNYITGEDIQYPVVYHHQNQTNVAVPSLVSEFETVTGMAVGESEHMPSRVRLFYFPLFSWPWEEGTMWPYLARFDSHDVEEIWDEWQDATYADLTSWPATDSALGTTTGLVASGGKGIAYDAFNLRAGEAHRSGLHIYCLASVEDVITGLDVEVFEKVNIERAGEGLPPLDIQLNLQWAAQRHADDMAAHYEHYESVMGTDDAHIGTDNSSAYLRIHQEGYNLFLHTWLLSSTGENVGHIAIEGTPPPDFSFSEEIVQGWKGSPPHWAKITNDVVTETGVAHAIAANGTYFFCQTFGHRPGKWQGYSPMPATGIKAYMDSNFHWTGTGDESRLPKIYLI